MTNTGPASVIHNPAETFRQRPERESDRVTPPNRSQGRAIIVIPDRLLVQPPRRPADGDKPYRNVTFTGRDENGKTRFAAMRGTVSAFKRDADGSDKRYGFVLPPANPISQTVAVFDAPVDCLSHFTLCKEGFIPPFNGWRLSLGGTSVLALEHFLENHVEVIHCLICTDNDDAGEEAADRIAELPGIIAERVLPGAENDFNDLLQALLKAERTQGRGAIHRANHERS